MVAQEGPVQVEVGNKEPHLKCTASAHCLVCGTFHYKGYSAIGTLREQSDELILSEHNYAAQLASHNPSCEILHSFEIDQGECPWCGMELKRKYQVHNYYIGSNRLQDIESEKLHEFYRISQEHIRGCFKEHSRPRTVIFEKFKK